jgi:phosphatidylserine/phosphatidylglycerophosphate/cardiolipin synthase-like enzyme
VSTVEALPTVSSVAQPGRNCWRIEKATRASVIVDADAYFEAGRAAMLKAKRRIMLIGWDFDARIRLGARRLVGEPETLGDFVLWLVERQPQLEVFVLRWDVGAIRTLLRGATGVALVRWMLHKRIFVRLDHATPPGASHHHKIVVIDDCLAFCGGIDMTSNRWDTSDHLDTEPRRLSPRGTPYGPWHDATTALEGPVAAALGELARQRWRRAGGQPLEPLAITNDCWPPKLACHFTDVAIAICRSHPGTSGHQPIREIEATYLDLIAGASRYIYAESQYFASRRIAEAIARRLVEPDGPEIVLINPLNSHGWLEPIAMDTARARLCAALQRLDRHRRLRLYHPFTRDGRPIYVHAKIMVVDEEVLHVGSSNMNNRSLRLDTECDVMIDAGLPGNGKRAPVIRAIRDGLIAEHLGVAAAEVARRVEGSGSLIETIETLRGSGRSLRAYQIPDLKAVEKWLADNEVLDPEGPEEMFESFTKRGLLRRLRSAFATGLITVKAGPADRRADAHGAASPP